MYKHERGNIRTRPYNTPISKKYLVHVPNESLCNEKKAEKEVSPTYALKGQSPGKKNVLPRYLDTHRWKTGAGEGKSVRKSPPTHIMEKSRFKTNPAKPIPQFHTPTDWPLNAAVKPRNTQAQKNTIPNINPKTCLHVVNEVDVKSTALSAHVMMMSKASNVTPGLSESTSLSVFEKFPDLIFEQYEFGNMPHVSWDKENMILNNSGDDKVETGCQYVDFVVNTVNNGTTMEDSTTYADSKINTKDVRISPTPRLKVIAEKFKRYKKEYVEVRQLEERIVCAEYDVFTKEDTQKPIQTMRAYFAMSLNNGQQSPLHNIPSLVKKNFKLEEDSIAKEFEREIEIIDETRPENRVYLRELCNLLKKRQVLPTKNNGSSSDLLAIYRMAQNNITPRDYNISTTNLLSKSELQAVKNLLAKCESRVDNVSRKKITLEPDLKSDSDIKASPKSSVFFGSFMYRVLRRLDLKNSVSKLLHL